ncbi:MAG: 23S rRNA (adenine(2503)-C(2))-methyltransferase RlmN [Acidobacteria bacterium]|nr:23S rRNA (adenine(2503)-C(2))-methyltransferase RlmN [Acidobacteriota bacterium]
MPEPTQNLFGSEEITLRERLAPVTPHPFHAGQIFHWIYGRGVTDFGKMTDLPLPIRAVLNDRFRIHPPAIASVARAADGTTKFTIRLEDGEEVESVLIPEGRRITLCISSQVGCALGCRFCLTAEMGLRRNLTPGEIVGQVWSLRQHAGLFDRTFNLVLMGMGEPMCNLDAVMAALGILADQRSFATPIRRVTLSTVGHVPGIRALARYPDRPRLAISLVATTDAQRDRLMPINRKYPIRELFSALREYPLRPKERITFEFVLMAGINDSLEEARRLARLLHGLRSKVNLIRYNRTGRGEFSPPAEYRVKRFRDRLLELGIPVSIRKQKGEEIYAACGQLALRRDVPPPGGKAGGGGPQSGRSG